ncbi:MAG: LysR family transcriptional regulator [Bdellovibrio sp.]
MTLDQLRVLEMIVSTGSFRAASQNLHRAQSAVSYAIRSLEDELGFQIFSRAQYRPRLTSQGEAFLKKTRDVLFQYSELAETADFLKRGHEPTLRLAVSALWPLPTLVDALKDFSRQFPQTEIKIIHDVLSNDEQLLGERADLALGHIFNDRSLLLTEKLLEVNMIAVCANRYPLALAAAKKKMAKDDFKKYPQIILASTVPNSQRSAGISHPDNTLSVQDYLTKKAFLEAGLGWGRMPEHLVRDEIKRKTLVTLPQKPEIIPCHIARHSQKELGPCGKFIWNYFSRGQKNKRL